MRLSLITLFVFIGTLFAYSQVAFKFSWTPRTNGADCSGIVTEYPSGSLDIVRIHDGATIHEVVTPDPNQHAAFDSNIGPVSSGDKVYLVLTLPDGKTIQYDDILGPNNNPSITREVSAHLVAYINQATDHACSQRKDAVYQ